MPNGYLPLGDAAAVNFGQVVAVVDGRAVGHLLLADNSVQPGDPIAADYVPVFDAVSNVWVAHRHRRTGLACVLLKLARAAYPLVELQRPFAGRRRLGGRVRSRPRRRRSEQPVPVWVRGEVQAVLRRAEEGRATGPRTYDLRIVVTVDRPDTVLADFLAELREVAVHHPGIEPHSIAEHHDGPRVHPPPRFDRKVATA